MTENNKVLQLLYTVFLGVLLAIFVGVGINTFYTAPEAPEWPTQFNSYNKEPTEEEITAQKEFDEKMKLHDKEMEPYNRNVSIITLVASVIFLVASLVYEKKIKVIADGIMLGGIFTLIYSLGRGFASGSSKYSFFVISASLVIVIFLGFHRFVKPTNKSIRK